MAQALSVTPEGHDTWNAFVAKYYAAKAAEDAFDKEHCGHISDDLPCGPERTALVEAVPKWVWAQGEVLGDARCEAEDGLMVIPSPNLLCLILKLYICRADGRDLNGFDDLLAAEAEAFLAAAVDAAAPATSPVREPNQGERHD